MSPLLRELVYGSYLNAKKYLNGHDSSTRDISLTSELLRRLNIKFNQWPRVTVTGSKGKGSTSVLLASILAASGEKVGLITSPSLRKFNERIRIDGKCVSDQELEQVAKEIASTVRAIVSELKPPNYLGTGGVILALAAKIFVKHKVTAIVVEAGRGGEYDEARLIEANVSVITPILLKHAFKIGPTLTDIAKTKTYITPTGGIIISARQKAIVKRAIGEAAKKLSSPVLSVGSDIKISNQELGINGTFCDLSVDGNSYKHLPIALVGSYQAENAATAVLAALTLKKFGARCTKEGIYKGVAQVSWPGRCQILQKNPWIFLDGAINKDSAKHIYQIINTLPVKRITAVIAIHTAKDLEGVCSVIAKVANKIILTEAHKRSLEWDRKSLLKSGSKYFQNITYIPEINDAFESAIKNARRDEGILLLGHQSFVGAALEFWNIETCKLW